MRGGKAGLAPHLDHLYISLAVMASFASDPYLVYAAATDLSHFPFSD